jgi:hypothetical protein
VPVRSLAEQFFAERDIVPPSSSALFAAAATGAIRRSIPRWLGREEAPGRPKERLRYYFRGQASSTWGLSSTLYRAVHDANRVTEAGLARAEKAVLQEMRRQGLGHRMNDGELLMVLQHHAIPTTLIDFCRSALPALYFAAEQNDDQDGRLIVIGQRIDKLGGYPKLALGSARQLPWLDAAVGRSSITQAWSNTVACVDDAALDPRMRA